MYKKISFLTALLSAAILVSAQHINPKTKTQVTFSSVNEVGLLTGGAGQSATFQTINGIRLGKWFTGIGAAIDYYGTRKCTFILCVQRDFFDTKSTPFIYVNGGVNVPWATSAQTANKGYVGDANKGLYFDGGIGMKLQTRSMGAVVFSAGYSYKKSSEKVEIFNIWSSFWPQTTTYQHYQYQYRRIVFKIGLQL